jgi:hypothetical protein
MRAHLTHKSPMVLCLTKYASGAHLTNRLLLLFIYNNLVLHYPWSSMDYSEIMLLFRRIIGPVYQYMCD